MRALQKQSSVSISQSFRKCLLVLPSRGAFPWNEVKAGEAPGLGSDLPSAGKGAGPKLWWDWDVLGYSIPLWELESQPCRKQKDRRSMKEEITLKMLENSNLRNICMFQDLADI